MKKKLKHEPKRTCSWEYCGIDFKEWCSHCETEKIIKRIAFPYSKETYPTPPSDAQRERYNKMCADWVERGILPEKGVNP